MEGSGALEMKKASNLNTNHIASIDFYKGVTIGRFTGSVAFGNLTETQAEFRANLNGRSPKIF